MKYFLLLLFSVAVSNGFSNSLWQKVYAKNIQIEGDRKIKPQTSAVFKLDNASFSLLKQSIPTEQSGRSVIITLPMPDGTTSDFKVFERSCMEPALAAKYPTIKTYQAVSIENPSVIAKLDYTEFGFHAMVFSNEGIYFIDPYSTINTGFYNCYYKNGYTREIPSFSVCATKTPTDNEDVNSANYRQIGTDPSITNIISDGKIRTFRLALACTIEYAAAVASPTITKPRVLSAMVTTMNRVNGVYEKELSIHMNLIAKEDTLIFISSDSYTNNDGYSMLAQNQTVCDTRIGNSNYDIGHVFSTGGGGIAGLGVVCSTGDKANGVTGLSNPVGDGFDIDYVAHEMGHQFGGNHTFNANTGSCSSGNRNSSTAYEVGSGTTIMAYAGICDNNNPQPHSNDYFHRASLREIFNYISGTSCAAITNTGTVAPTVNSYVSTYYIPYKTSFEVAASATDPAGHPLKYCWEEWDLGPAGNWNATNNTKAPIFRSFSPNISNQRVFPIWDSLIKNNIKYLGEVLPETTRDIKLRCTVRALDANGYGIFSAPENDLTIKSVTTTSLFRVTSQTTATTITGNTNQTITWDVAGTTDAPISTANVDIYLSLDSARTFPYLLASGTANDGSQVVLIPDVATTNASARIKVKGNGNVFFDLNDGWIKINQAAPVVAASFTPNDTVICGGNSILFTNTSTGNPDSVRWTINGGTPSTSTSKTTISSIFNTSGVYTVSLIVYKSGVASSPFSKTVTVNPTATTNISQTICQGESVTVGADIYTSTGNYTTHLQTSKGCDSTVNLALTVNPTATTNISRTICLGDNVTIGTDVYTVAGNYTTHLQTSKGCDSTVNLALTVNPTATTNISQTICQGESVTVGADIYTSTGNYINHLQTSTGCDSTVNLALTVNPTATTNISRTICQGESVTIGTDFYTTAGNYTTHLQTSKGCDSTVNLALTVNPTATISISRIICQGGNVIIGSDVYTSTGNYTTHLQTSKGCDSTVNLALTVNPTATTNISRTICQGGNVTIGTDVYTTTGNYTTHLQTSKGCDSTVNLALTVNPTATTNLSRTICLGDNVTIGTDVYTSTGNYVNHLQTSKGCDSTVNLALTVNPTATTNISRTICQGGNVTIGTDVYTIAGNYTTHLQTSTGCDSTVNLALTINLTATTNISRTICQGSNVTIGTDVYTIAGNYTTHLQTSTGCDSTVNLALIVNPLPTTPNITQSNDTLFSSTIGSGATYYWYKTGILVATTSEPFYVVIDAGVYTLKVISNDCESILSAAFNAVSTGIKNNKSDVAFAVFPNPNNGQFEIKIIAVTNENYQLKLYNITGQEIKNEVVEIQKGLNVIQFNLNTIEKGLYFISLINKVGVSTQNIIVQ